MCQSFPSYTHTFILHLNIPGGIWLLKATADALIQIVILNNSDQDLGFTKTFTYLGISKALDFFY